ncbi:uncharacterized protein LOC110901360 [Helianthus annuus]|uniref:uncharacterized protein LOC110901360 n=1 Tax=Helianthus annuus TaxID=4232 RepID=UPI000B8F77CF|nr:uncharacterized protein LOC110901360 [Helianthus annuus]
MACKPPIYNREVDPIICQRWLGDIKGVFERTHWDESDFVAYGTGQLRGQAKDWWDNKKNEIGVEAAKTMTWEEFKTPFLKHRSPKAVINKIMEEFMQLREFMTPSKYKTLTEIINVAREREIKLKKQVERGERRAQDVNPSPTKKARTGELGKKVDVKGGSPSCKVCGKGHKGECRFKDKSCPICGKTRHTASLCPGKVFVCYKCYQPGHKKSECPELVGKRDTKESPTEAPKAKARSFQLTAAEAKTEPHVVSEVEIGDNKSFIVCDICRGCKLNIDNEEYLINLIPMSMGQFQVVVGMDWLSQHHAKVVCFRKEIKLTSPSGKHVTIYGEKGGNPIICSMMKAHKLMKHGCKAFMIYANEPEKELPKIGDVPVVRDFEDVFPDDLPGMPPEREVEFGIELIPGAKPIAKAPYRLAPSELQELIFKMSDGNDDNPVQTSTEQMKEIIAEEVGKEIEGSLSGFIVYPHTGNTPS